MIGRVIEFAEGKRHLSLYRGFLKISERGEEMARLPLDDIGAILAHAEGLTYSNNLLVQLAERGIPLIFCASNHMPAALLWPTVGHHGQAGRIEDQAAASTPLKKNLWAQIVRSKIAGQKGTLMKTGQEGAGFDLLARKVRSGDPGNVEAEAARRYWPLLMGPAFRRDRAAPDANALLNYGYTVLRAATARAVMASGLHPSLGLHHSNRNNPHRLVDDLMEPFRPLVDFEVWQWVNEGQTVLTPEVKAALARLMVIDVPTEAGISPVMTALERLCHSLVQAYAGEHKKLSLPRPPLPLTG